MEIYTGEKPAAISDTVKIRPLMDGNASKTTSTGDNMLKSDH